MSKRVKDAIAQAIPLADESTRHWAVEAMLSGEELRLLMPSSNARMSATGDYVSPVPLPDVRVKIAHRSFDRDAFMLQYVYNGEYAELEVDCMEFLRATTEDLLSWGDAAFMG